MRFGLNFGFASKGDSVLTISPDGTMNWTNFTTAVGEKATISDEKNVPGSITPNNIAAIAITDVHTIDYENGIFETTFNIENTAGIKPLGSAIKISVDGVVYLFEWKLSTDAVLTYVNNSKYLFEELFSHTDTADVVSAEYEIIYGVSHNGELVTYNGELVTYGDAA